MRFRTLFLSANQFPTESSFSIQFTVLKDLCVYPPIHPHKTRGKTALLIPSVSIVGPSSSSSAVVDLEGGC